MATARSGRPDAFEEIDRLVCGAGFVPTAAAVRTRALQAAARGKTRDLPLSAQIVDALLARREKRVVLFTGFVRPDAYPCGENDGPLGAVALARALRRAGFEAAICADPEVLDHTTWLAAEIRSDASTASIPGDLSGRSREPIDVAIAIEKPGANRLGFLHAWDGRRIESGSIPIDSLFLAPDDPQRLTVAIGDRGNEIGFGSIYDELVSLVPEARHCACGCGGGIAAVTPANLLFPAAVSNWGAYGLCAGLALATRDRTLLFRPNEEERLLNIAAIRGCRDGLLRTATFGVDGISGAVSMRIVDALCRLVEAELPEG